MVCIRNNDFVSISLRRIVSIASFGIGRDHICRTIEYIGIVLFIISGLPLDSHPDRMLFWFMIFLIIFYEVDYVVMPQFRITMALITDFPHYIVKVIKRVYDLFDIIFLQCPYGFDFWIIAHAVDFFSLVVPVNISICTIHIVFTVKGMTKPGIFLIRPLCFYTPAFKQHNRDIDSPFTSLNHSGSKPVEVSLIKFIDIKFRTAI